MTCPHGMGSPDGCVNCILKEKDDEIGRLMTELQLATHKCITCGVIASGSDRQPIYQRGGKWDSPQAEMVRELRKERDEARLMHIQIARTATELSTTEWCKMWGVEETSEIHCLLRSNKQGVAIASAILAAGPTPVHPAPSANKHATNEPICPVCNDARMTARMEKI